MYIGPICRPTLVKRCTQIEKGVCVCVCVCVFVCVRLQGLKRLVLHM